jgi:hypothetical protein
MLAPAQQRAHKRSMRKQVRAFLQRRQRSPGATTTGVAAQWRFADAEENIESATLTGGWAHADSIDAENRALTGPGVCADGHVRLCYVLPHGRRKCCLLNTVYSAAVWSPPFADVTVFSHMLSTWPQPDPDVVDGNEVRHPLITGPPLFTGGVRRSLRGRCVTLLTERACGRCRCFGR